MIGRLPSALLLATALLVTAACGGSSESLGDQTTPTRPPTTAPAKAPVKAMLPTPYQPLWPFTDLEQVRDWQQGNQAAWHLSADQTALRFARDFLGFREIGQVVSRKLAGADARIGVGYRSPDSGRPSSAAVVHLLKAGTGGNAPWEVVGTDDGPAFTLDTPAYGAAISSPVTVGGKITGVDESIHIQIRQPSTASPLGRHCCLPAGGQNARWSAPVRWRGATDPVLTIAAWTGGHIADVERFAVTGVRP